MIAFCLQDSSVAGSVVVVEPVETTTVELSPQRAFRCFDASMLRQAQRPHFVCGILQWLGRRGG